MSRHNYSITKKRQPACKPGSVRGLPPAMTIHLGRPLLDASSNQPGQRRGNAPAARLPANGLPPLFGLAPGGVCRAAPVASRAVRSYRTLSPLPRNAGRFAFCGTFPGVAPAGRYPAPCFHGARTFLCGRSPQRSSSRLAKEDKATSAEPVKRPCPSGNKFRVARIGPWPARAWQLLQTWASRSTRT